jgi:ribosomal protein L7/L12
MMVRFDVQGEGAFYLPEEQANAVLTLFKSLNASFVDPGEVRTEVFVRYVGPRKLYAIKRLRSARVDLGIPLGDGGRGYNLKEAKAVLDRASPGKVLLGNLPASQAQTLKVYLESEPGFTVTFGSPLLMLAEVAE